MTKNTNNIEDFFTELSVQDFLDVGLNQVAYIRREKTKADQKSESNSAYNYVVYGADGAQISVMDSYDTAVVAIRLNDLHPVTVQ